MISSILPLPLDAVPFLDPAHLDTAGMHAAQEFITQGTPINTARSYASALRYWTAWYALRYGQTLGVDPVPVAVASQFIVDHLQRQTRDGLGQELPMAIDTRLVELGAKSKLGPLTYATVSHRLAVLAKWHRLRGWDPPGDDHRIKTLMAKARRAQVQRGVMVRKKTALVAEPLQAMLATCSDGVRGVRDRALLLFAWSGGGRRRSEVVAVQIEDIRRLDAKTWTYVLGHTKTNASGVRREKPLTGEAVLALDAWLHFLPFTTGPLFRRVYRNGRAGNGLTPDQVARIVQRRARLAGLSGDWAAHSLRSGFVTESGRQGVPLGEVMAMTEHRSVGTVMGYFQAGSLLSSRATTLLATVLSSGTSQGVPDLIEPVSDQNQDIP